MEIPAKAVLHALGYTSQTLAADIGVSVSQARRILSDNGKIFFGEFMDICKVIGIKLSVMGGMKKPGTLKDEETTA